MPNLFTLFSFLELLCLFVYLIALRTLILHFLKNR